MLNLKKLKEDITGKLKNATPEYKGDSNKFEINKTQAVMGATILGGAYAIGIGPVLLLAAGYTAVKGYQAYKDMRG